MGEESGGGGGGGGGAAKRWPSAAEPAACCQINFSRYLLQEIFKAWQGHMAKVRAIKGRRGGGGGGRVPRPGVETMKTRNF